MRKRKKLLQLNEKGAAIAMFAITLTMLTIVGVLAVDMAYLYTTKGQLQNAADSAAMAGAGAISTALGKVGGMEPGEIDFTAKKVAKLFAEENWAGDASISLEEDDMVTGLWDFSTRTFTEGVSPPNAIEITARQNVNRLFFGQLLGMSGVPVSSKAYAALGGRNVMLVLDASRSMNEDFGTGKLIDQLKDAAEYFVDNLQTTLVDDRVGIFYYHTFVVDTPSKSSELVDPGEDGVKEDLLSKIAAGAWANWSAGKGKPPRDGWTCIACGMQAAKNEFASSRPTEQGVKIMIVMTDGHPNVTLDAAENPSTVGTYAYEHSVNYFGPKANQVVKDELLDMTEKLAEESVIIYTIGLGDVDDELLAEMAQITGGQYYYASSADKLDDIFLNISTDIPIILAK